MLDQRDAESLAIKKFAEIYSRGVSNIVCPDFREWEIEEHRVAVMAMMEGRGLIGGRMDEAGYPFAYFTIEPAVLIAAREIEDKEREKKDMIESLKFTVRRHPATAWSFIIFVAVGAALAFINQVLTFLKNIRAID